MDDTSSNKHFILVHGLGQGAWCWYKVATMLRSAGHRVTALDLAASGVHPALIGEVASFEDYSRPLLDAVAAAKAGERLVLVGHSYGGLSVALAVERAPQEVAAAVFLAAVMPSSGRRMGFAAGEMARRATPEYVMDCQMLPINTNRGPGIAFLYGPNFLADKFYNKCAPEDLTLGKLLVRPCSLFMDDPMMNDDKLLTDDNYGSVKRVFVVADEDRAIKEELQRWMIALSPGTEVEEIAGADHFAMSSKPRELCDVIVKI